jgi:hypothetical protein
MSPQQVFGGFDERFRDWGAEDVELGYRLHRHGVPLVADIRPWAVENPHERDPDASMVTAKRSGPGHRSRRAARS